MAETDKLRNMLDNLINDKTEQAQVFFHDYLQTKMTDVIGKNSETTQKKDSNKE